MTSSTLRIATPTGALHVEITEPLLPWTVDAPTLVFCHGVATDCGIWAGWLPVLAPHARIVRFDTRGFGRSIDPGHPIDWSLDRFADDILAVADATGTGRFHLVGESMGGTVCLQLASRGEPRLLSLTCVSTSHRGSTIRRVDEWRARAEGEGIEAWSDRMMSDRFAPGAIGDGPWRWFSDTQRATPIASLLDAADMLVRSDLSEAVARIAVPTLLLAPDSSPFIPLAIPVELHARIAGARLAVFPGVRHGLAFSHAAQCADLVKQTFIDP